MRTVNAQTTTQPSWLRSTAFWHGNADNRMGQPSGGVQQEDKVQENTAADQT